MNVYELVTDDKSPTRNFLVSADNEREIFESNYLPTLMTEKAGRFAMVTSRTVFQIAHKLWRVEVSLEFIDRAPC